MADSIEEFKEYAPSLESYWRSIILFGRNVASYKFALAESLLELADSGKTVVTLEELSLPFSTHICEHIAHSPKQATSKSSAFLEACEQYNSGKITQSDLLAVTEVKGFVNVIDAFHTVNLKTIPISFYEKDYTNGHKRIILTDDIYRLRETPYSDNFTAETEARWNLVESAWEMNISRNLLNVRYEEETRMFFVDEKYHRKTITSARGALNGYQKGKCFYCFDDISVSTSETNNCDVDHFFPHTLQPLLPDVNLDGVWNLVLACQTCNRGANGKFARVPSIKYLERLHKRNEFLISSHHPLRDTIIRQTGATEEERRHFLQSVDHRAIDVLVHRWDTPEVAPATF